MSRNYFIFDQNMCVGCEACVVACINENGMQEPDPWRTIGHDNPNRLPGIPLFYLSMACNHCEVAPCMDHCPALAYSRDPVTGAVLIDEKACLGCKYCSWNCPYDAPKYMPATGIIEKCNFCTDRIGESRKPACASLCPTAALDFSFEEIDKKALSGGIKVPVETHPSMLIKKPKNIDGPEIDHTLFEEVIKSKPTTKPNTKITALKEWTLVVFTFIVAVMVAVVSLDVLKDQSSITKIVFMCVGGLAAVMSLLHLGKPFRAWRAILNLRRSWISREFLCFMLFYGLTFIDLFILEVPLWILIVSGILLLVSIDQLYRPAQHHWSWNIHSGQVIFIALSYFLLLGGFYWFFAGLMAVRLALWALNHPAIGIVMASLRILSMVLTGVFIVWGLPFWSIVLVFSIGELLDRIGFYEGLEVHGEFSLTANDTKGT